jgi:hypothetical protein
VDARLVAEGAEALGAGLGAAACVLVCIAGEVGMCASVAGADAELADDEVCRCAYLADACLAGRADAPFFVALVPELAGEVLAGDDAAPGAGPLLELPEPPQPAAVSAIAASSASALCGWGPRVIVMYFSSSSARHAPGAF